MRQPSVQHGFILLPVVLALVLIATIAFLLNNQSAINVDTVAGEAQARQVDAIAAAGMAHAVWGAQNSSCAGDMGMTTVPFGQAGTDSYIATITTPGGATTAYPNLAADQDAWFRSDDPTSNSGTNTDMHLRMESGNLEYALYRFDLSSLPAGSQINSASAWLYVTNSGPGGGAFPEGPLTVHRVTADWTETGATWETMNTHYDSAVIATVPAQPQDGVWVQINLTAQVQAWVNSGEPNFGIMLRPSAEGTHGKFVSREGVASQQPRLDVIVGTGPATPMTISATGTLTGNPSPANDITRTLTRSTMPAYQPASNLILQPDAAAGQDAYIWESTKSSNYGTNDETWVASTPPANNRSLALFRFDMAALPQGAKVLNASLSLHHRNGYDPNVPVTAHRITKAWEEDSVTWNNYKTGMPWSSAGGDLDASVVATTNVGPGNNTRYEWDITNLVLGWSNGTYPNEGVALRTVEPSIFGERFDTSDHADSTRHPRLSITYACECGSPCLAPQGSGTVGMVVIDPTTLAPSDAYKKALFESWGYTVNVIGENTNAAGYMTAAASNDVFFISETVNLSQVGTRIKDVPIGVVSQDGAYNSQLGIATGSAWTVGSSINVTDTSHYITALFPTGPLDIYSGGMEQLTVSGTVAPGLQTLADSGGADSLVVLAKGADMTGGGTAAGRRVMLPLGRETKFSWDYLNSNGLLLVQRALQWGTGNTGEAPAKQLLFVAASASPTVQEQLRIDLIESWGYGVTVIDDNDSQANFDAAVAASDVAYVSSTVSNTALGTKLKAATIGVVNENMPLAQTFGFTSGYQTYARDQIRVTDNSHYITSPLALGYLPIFTSLQTVYQRGSTAGEVFMLADSFNIGNDGNNKPSLLVINTGGALDGGGTAAGRRVQLPWGSNTFNVAALNADGQGIMQRAIEWAEGYGCSTNKPLLMLVGDSVNPTVEELSRATLLESWCYSVSMVTASVPQTTYDTFADTYDVVYVPSSVNYADVTSKLKLQPVGVVNEVSTLSAYLGFTSGTSGYTGTVTELTDNTHYITSGLTLGNLAITTTSTSLRTFVNTMGPGVHILSTGPSSTNAMIMTLDTGDALLWGGNAPDRRVMLPWGGSSTFDPNNLTADGLTILQRAIEWAAGVSGGGSGGGGEPPPVVPVFEEFTETALGSDGTSLSISKPQGTLAGDLLIAAVATDGDNSKTLSAPAGWNLVYVARSNKKVSFGVWWKLAGASESASYTFYWGKNENAYGWIMRFTGHDPAGPIHTYSGDLGSSTVPPSPSVTATVDNTLILRLGGFDDDLITAGDPGLPGHTAINMSDSGNGNATVSGGSGYVLQPAAGASGTSSFALTGSNSYVTVTLAIAPAP